MAAHLKVLARAFVDILFPRFCIACGKPMPADIEPDICPACEPTLALPAGRYCPRCAFPMAEFASTCAHCRSMNLAFAASTAFGPFAGILRDRLLAYKYGGKRFLARTFGALTAHAARSAWPDISFQAVLPVPLHRSRKSERGFDQAEDLAYHTARFLGVKHRPGLLKRTKFTESQVGLTKAARLANVKGAFKAVSRPPTGRVLIVDDIMTTGATASEAARALKKAGVENVYAVVVARAGITNASASLPHANTTEGART